MAEQEQRKLEAQAAARKREDDAILMALMNEILD